jgi:hypothetical protein
MLFGSKNRRPGGVRPIEPQRFTFEVRVESRFTRTSSFEMISRESRFAARLSASRDIMKKTHALATAVTAATLSLIGSAHAWAGDAYTFPSMSGASITTNAPAFAPPAADASAQAVVPEATSSVSISSGHASYKFVPPAPTSGRAHGERFGMTARAAEAYAYQFLNQMLNSASYANYAADYTRLFAPGYAVSTWTGRVFGTVDAGHGGPVDSWTAAAYYMPRLAGPTRRRESAPDLNPMPQLRPHPELETHPTFGKGN